MSGKILPCIRRKNIHPSIVLVTALERPKCLSTISKICYKKEKTKKKLKHFSLPLNLKKASLGWDSNFNLEKFEPFECNKNLLGKLIDCESIYLSTEPLEKMWSRTDMGFWSRVLQGFSHSLWIGDDNHLFTILEDNNRRCNTRYYIAFPYTFDKNFKSFCRQPRVSLSDSPCLLTPNAHPKIQSERLGHQLWIWGYGETRVIGHTYTPITLSSFSSRAASWKAQVTGG